MNLFLLLGSRRPVAPFAILVPQFPVRSTRCGSTAVAHQSVYHALHGWAASRIRPEIGDEISGGVQSQGHVPSTLAHSHPKVLSLHTGTITPKIEARQVIIARPQVGLEAQSTAAYPVDISKRGQWPRPPLQELESFCARLAHVARPPPTSRR